MAHLTSSVERTQPLQKKQSDITVAALVEAPLPESRAPKRVKLRATIMTAARTVTPCDRIRAILRA
jgi:hypothetical protein